MAKTAKRMLSVLLAALLLCCALSVGAAAEPVDTANAKSIGLIIPKLVSPSGKTSFIVSGASVYSFTPALSGKYRIASNSLGVYPLYQRYNDLFGGNYETLFRVMFLIVDLPNYLLNFLFNLLLETIFPSGNPSMKLYDAQGNLIDQANDEGFPLFKWSRQDYRKAVSLKGGQTYYIVVNTASDAINIPYFISVWPWL
ncbi:MAG: hypothetical protein LBG83_02190 [Oscillospiraceae bacterium]|nr:hypothetical protein [Oscillospiraceae bacterium]